MRAGPEPAVEQEQDQEEPEENKSEDEQDEGDEAYGDYFSEEEQDRVGAEDSGGDSLGEDDADVAALQEKVRKLQATIKAKKAQSHKGTRGDQPEREIDFKAITAAAQHIPKLARLPKSNFAIWERHVLDVAYARAWPITAWREKEDWD